MDKIFRALSDRNRRMIVTLLKNRELKVTEILSYLSIGQATVSSHLSVLRKAGLVEVRVSGRERFYSLNKAEFLKFAEVINKFVDREKSKILEKDIVIR